MIDTRAIALAAAKAFPHDSKSAAYESANEVFDEASNEIDQLRGSILYIRQVLIDEGEGQFTELILECCYALGDVSDEF